MRERSRRRAARVDFESLVAPEEVATFDSGSEYEGDDHMEVDGDGDDDLDLEMEAELPSEPETAADSGGDSEQILLKEEVQTAPAARSRRAVARTPQRPAAPLSASRIENLRDRLMLFYGESNAELVRAIKLRHKWSDYLFSVPASELEPVDTNTISAPSMMSPLVMLDKEFKASGIPVTIDGLVIEPSMQRKSETAGVLNAGHGVLALDWNPSGSLLALALRTGAGDSMNASTVQPELAPLYEPCDSESLLHVYQVEGSRISAFASIQGFYGPVVKLQWSTSSALAVLFANGSVGLVDVAAPGHYKLELNALPTITGAKASCVCWRGHSIVVGYADGLVAEFDTAAEPTPSYVTQLHDSVVTSVVSGWPNLTNYIFTSGVDGNLKVTDTRDLRLVRKAPRLKHLAPVAAYLALADSFISLEDANTAKLVPVRHPSVQMTLTSVTRHDAGVTAVATSPSHPLLLTGGQDGALHITNPLRRTMATRRKRDLQLDCTIWRLECSHKTSEYRFVELLTAGTLSTKREGLNNMSIYPASVAVSSVAWKPCSTWYAAGTASGLVRIEDVDG